MKRNSPLIIVSAVSVLIIIIYIVGIQQKPGAGVSVQPPSLTELTGGGASQQSQLQAPPASPTAPLKSSSATIIRDDLARFWIVWQGRKYLLSPAGIPQEKANLLPTVDATKKILGVVNCTQVPADRVVLLAYELYLLKDPFKYKLAYQQVTGNYAGSIPTAQGCLLPAVQ